MNRVAINKDLIRWAESHPTWSNALLGLRRAGEDTGVVVVINGVFGNNTRQPLDPEEFRGFVLCDRHAPLIFINGADFKSAQMFTLAHELAHLWLGQDGVFNLPDLQPSEDALEKLCNRVAAEVLIPSRELEACWPELKQGDAPYNALARRFKVSPMVAARAGKLLYQDAYRLTGLYGKTFDQFAQELGFGPG